MVSYDGGAARKKRADLKTWQESRRVDPDAYPVLSAFANPLLPPAREIIGREEERDQVLSAMYRPELSSVVLLADAGTGKALADDTLVPVDDSRVFAQISDIAVGDYVFGRDGKPTPVVGVFPQGMKSAFRVTTDFGDPLVANDEHIWTVYDRRRDCEITTTLSDLLSEGLFLSGGEPRFLVPRGEGVQRSSSFGFDKSVGRRGVILPGALGGSFAERSDLVAALDEHFIIEPAGRNCVRLRTGDGEMAQTVASLLSGTGELARVDVGVDGEPCDVLWRRTPQDYQPIVNVEPMDSVPMTCIKVMADDGLFQAGLGHVVTHNTALVQSVMQRDPDRLYLEVDPAKLIAGLNSDKEMGDRLKRLFEDAENYAASESTELVVFIDEFHQIVQLSEAAVEALKPVLADAGTRGLRIIGATTFEEYNEHIKKNQPLMQRLQPIRVNSPDNETTVKILRGFTHQYGVADQITGDEILRQIVEITNTYMPADSQPRKSVRVLDAMVGVHRYTGRPMDVAMMHEVIEESMGISLAFGVDGQAIKESLDAKVYAQDNASTVLNRRLQLCVANLNNPNKPMMSALFVGSTGVGKTEMTKQLTNLMFGDDVKRLIRFDMSEFAEESSLDVFRDELTQRVSNMGHAVVLFDEVEKASKWHNRLLLQVLDDGRLSDRYGRTTSFLNTYIILTTNAGSKIFNDIGEYAASDTGDGDSLDDYLKLIESNLRDQGDFPAELLSRIDEIVPFQPLSRETKRKITKNKLLELRNNVAAKHGVTLRIDPSVVQYLTDDLSSTTADEGGARDAARILEQQVATEVASFLNAHHDVKTISVTIAGQMWTDNKFKRKSQAYPFVFADD